MSVKTRDFKVEKILAHGAGSAGKSYSISTIFKLKPFNPNLRMVYLATERNALSGLENGLKANGIKLEAGELIVCIAKDSKAKTAFKTQASAVREFMSKTDSEAQQTDSKSTGGKEKYQLYLDMMNTLDNFIGYDYVTKETVRIGSIGDLDCNDILVIDGLTPITLALWNAIKGDRVVSTLRDYHAVQTQLRQLTFNLMNSDCSVIMLAHTDRITDDIDKVEKLRIALGAGNALAGSYAGFWADVIYAYQKASGERVWAGRKLGVETVARNFPEADGLEPDFSKYNFFVPQEERENG